LSMASKQRRRPTRIKPERLGLIQSNPKRFRIILGSNRLMRRDHQLMKLVILLLSLSLFKIVLCPL
jgi:hypothetical protein